MILLLLTLSASSGYADFDCTNKLWFRSNTTACECEEKTVTMRGPLQLGICAEPVPPGWYGCQQYEIIYDGVGHGYLVLSLQIQPPLTNDQICDMSQGFNTKEKCEDYHFSGLEECHPLLGGPNDGSCNIYGMDENGCCKFMGTLSYGLHFQDPPGIAYYTFENPGLCGTDPSSGLIRMFQDPFLSRVPFNICEDLNPCKKCTEQSILNPLCSGGPNPSPTVPPPLPSPTPTPPIIPPHPSASPSPPVLPSPDPSPSTSPIIIGENKEFFGECPQGIVPHTDQIVCGATGALQTVSNASSLHVMFGTVGETQMNDIADATVTVNLNGATGTGSGHGEGINGAAVAKACSDAYAMARKDLGCN